MRITAKVPAEVVLVGTGAAWGGLRWLRASVLRGIYQQPRSTGPVPVPPGFALLSTSGPNPVEVLYVAPPVGAATVIFFHGNAMDLESSTETLIRLRDAGFGAAAIEYVGYGPSPTAKPSESRIADACELAISMLSGRTEMGEIILFGFSLGSAFAITMAARGYGQKLIIAAGFNSARRISSAQISWVPPRIFLGAEMLDNVGQARSVGIPTLVTHGSDDEMIPIAMGRELAAAFPRGHFIEVPGADHNGMGPHAATSAKIAATDPATWPSTWAPES